MTLLSFRSRVSGALRYLIANIYLLVLCIVWIHLSSHSYTYRALFRVTVGYIHTFSFDVVDYERSGPLGSTAPIVYLRLCGVRKQC